MERKKLRRLDDIQTTFNFEKIKNKNSLLKNEKTFFLRGEGGKNMRGIHGGFTRGDLLGENSPDTHF